MGAEATFVHAFQMALLVCAAFAAIGALIALIALVPARQENGSAVGIESH
jgi:hypothetical protein